MKTTHATVPFYAAPRRDLHSVPMASPVRPAVRSAMPSEGLFEAILDSSDSGVVVLDRVGRPCYMNATARKLLGPSVDLPPELSAQLVPMIARVSSLGRHVVTRCVLDELVMRAQVRPLGDRRGLTVLELSVARATRGVDVVVALSRGLHLSKSSAELLALLWRGLRNHEISQTLDVPIGTIKSRLYRLYRRLGVRNRAAAVLAAAEVLGSVE